MLKDRLRDVNIILASGSPRRQQFFRDLDLDFEIRLKEIEEVYPPDLKREEITNYLAKLKAGAFEGNLNQNDLLVTSDTIVWHENTALGKPKDRKDAIKILGSLSEKTHEVITSVCFMTADKTDLIYDVTKVTFNMLAKDQIEYYIDKYKPYDKAGAYGIQEWIGFTAVTRIDGSYSNVMGMPMHKVFEYLSTFGNK